VSHRPLVIGLAAILVAALFTGCSTWGFKSRIGDRVYPPVPYQRVQILYGWPNRPYEQIGICSVSGGAFASDVDMWRKLQKSAAQLGADAVVITGEGSSQVTLPGHSTTTGQVTTTGSATYNPYSRTAVGAAYATGQSHTIYSPPSTFSLPNNRGFAIKFTDTSSAASPIPGASTPRLPYGIPFRKADRWSQTPGGPEVPLARTATVVRSPYGKKVLVDVTGMARGTQVKCPETGKLFLVP